VRPLVIAALLFAFIAGVGAAGGFRGFLVSLPFGLAAFALLAASPLRRRDLRIEVHENGVVVHRGRRRTAVVFDDVDEVWFDLDPISTPTVTLAILRAFKLVDHDGVAHVVPLQVEHADDLARLIIRRCSLSLVADAEKALRAGATLTFGRVRIDAKGISVGNSRAEWSNLRLVRMQPDRISFFRAQTVIPWRTVAFDKVPHPTVFVKLVQSLAHRIESTTTPPRR